MIGSWVVIHKTFCNLILCQGQRCPNFTSCQLFKSMIALMIRRYQTKHSHKMIVRGFVNTNPGFLNDTTRINNCHFELLNHTSKKTLFSIKISSTFGFHSYFFTLFMKVNKSNFNFILIIFSRLPKPFLDKYRTLYKPMQVINQLMLYLSQMSN